MNMSEMPPDPNLNRCMFHGAGHRFSICRRWVHAPAVVGFDKPFVFQVQSRYGVTVVPNVLSSVPSVAQSSHIRVSLTRHE